MNKLNNMSIGEKRVFELNDFTAQITRNFGDKYDVAIKVGNEFEYQMSYDIDFVEGWLNDNKVQEATMQYTARPFENRFDDMPETLVIKSVTVSEFTVQLLADMLEKQFLGDAIIVGELSVYEDDFTAEWHNQGNFTHLDTQWVIMARMVK